jgi:hypothetical protein
VCFAALGFNFNINVEVTAFGLNIYINVEIAEYGFNLAAAVIRPGLKPEMWWDICRNSKFSLTLKTHGFP